MTAFFRHRSSRMAALAVSAIAALTLAACSTAGGESEDAAEGGDSAATEQTAAETNTPDPDTDESADEGTDDDADGNGPIEPVTVRLLTHDSFAADPETLAAFEEASGITVEILAQGHAGEILSKAILTKDNPLGDVIFGIDNSFASKALDADILAPYESSLAGHGSDKYAIDDSNRLTAVDFGDVCVNIDHRYFTAHDLAEPQTLRDLTKPEYANMFVTPDAETSSPGLAFMFATIAHFGTDGWVDYWRDLKDNGVKITSGWTEAYTVDFSGSSGAGDRPLVLSYASSPPSEVTESGEAPTSALLDTCFRQVEYAGVLSGTENPDAAGKVIDFLLSDEFQRDIPNLMWVYPVSEAAELPADWAEYAPVAEQPVELDPADIDNNREEWLATWTDLMRG